MQEDGGSELLFPTNPSCRLDLSFQSPKDTGIFKANFRGLRPPSHLLEAKAPARVIISDPQGLLASYLPIQPPNAPPQPWDPECRPTDHTLHPPNPLCVPASHRPGSSSPSRLSHTNVSSTKPSSVPRQGSCHHRAEAFSSPSPGQHTGLTLWVTGPLCPSWAFHQGPFIQELVFMRRFSRTFLDDPS